MSILRLRYKIAHRNPALGDVTPTVSIPAQWAIAAIAGSSVDLFLTSLNSCPDSSPDTYGQMPEIMRDTKTNEHERFSTRISQRLISWQGRLAIMGVLADLEAR